MCAHTHTHTHSVTQSCLTLWNPPGSYVHGIFQQEYWSRLPLPPPGDLPNPGIEPTSPALADGFFNLWATWQAPGSLAKYNPVCKAVVILKAAQAIYGSVSILYRGPWTIPPELKSWSHHVQALWPWAICCFLCVQFLHHKMGMLRIVVPFSEDFFGGD